MTRVFCHSAHHVMVMGLLAFCVACAPQVETPTATPDTTSNSVEQEDKIEQNIPQSPIAVVLEPNISQQFRGENEIEQRLAKALPELPYSTENLSEFAQQVNAYQWQQPLNPHPNGKIELEPAGVLKIQALLNWHHHGVGAVDGSFAQNTVKAMQAFQLARNLPQTDQMDVVTWNALNENTTLNQQPVLVHYTLTAEDVMLKTGQSQYRSVQEAVAEKFHMSQGLLKKLNPKTPLKVGQTITVYNPGQPNLQPITRVVAHQKLNILYAYNADGKMVASYPTTVGSRATPSPDGKFKIKNRILHPTYNKDFTNKDTVVASGPNNPVGRVWLGLNKQGYGIHGSPEPEGISRQQSSGCVRLTNWDALGLYGTIQEGAEVELIGKYPNQSPVITKTPKANLKQNLAPKNDANKKAELQKNVAQNKTGQNKAVPNQTVSNKAVQAKTEPKRDDAKKNDLKKDIKNEMDNIERLKKEQAKREQSKKEANKKDVSSTDSSKQEQKNQGNKGTNKEENKAKTKDTSS